MSCPREDAERFARELAAAWDDQKSHELLWETATRRAELSIGQVRVVDRLPAFLICQEWIVEPGGSGWEVRDWWGAADPYYSSAEELDALD